MRRSAIALTLVAALGGALAAPVFAQPKPTVGKDIQEWRLALCYGKQATKVDKHYGKVITDTVTHIFELSGKAADTKVLITECKSEPDFACYANSEAIFCREEPLAQIARVAAWLSAEAAFLATQHQGQVTLLEAVPQLSWVDALLLADAESIEGEKVFAERAEMILGRRDLDADSLNAIYSLVLDIYKYTNNDLEPDKDNGVLLVALDIYRQAFEYAMAFLVGHEGYHYTGNKCSLADKSRIEVNGLFNEIYKMQLKGGFFDPALTLDKHELAADLCGYRWMQAKADVRHRQHSPVIAALTKRIAIDVLVSPIFNGYLSSIEVNKLVEAAPVAKLVSGYLYPQSRLILASATLHHSERQYPETVKVCNDSAKALVTMIQYAVDSYPNTSGDISDAVLTQFPDGVVQAWNGGEWRKDSFSCTLKEKK